MPATRGIERKVVGLAEQYREAHRFIGPHGLDRGIEREAGIAAAAAVLAGHDAADAADVNLAPIPRRGPEVNADMAGQPARGRLDQHAEIGVGPILYGATAIAP